MKPEAKEILPRKVLAEVACAIPDYVHPNIVIIGSLAAGLLAVSKQPIFRRAHQGH